MLPPSFAGCLQRNAIPAKVELETSSGTKIPPEKCKMDDLADLPDAERSALFALSQWCGGKITSFLQLNLEQCFELLKLLDQIECFFPANSPDNPLKWTESGLERISDEIGKPPPILHLKSKEQLPKRKKEDSFTLKSYEPEYEGPPIEVEVQLNICGSFCLVLLIHHTTRS